MGTAGSSVSARQVTLVLGVSVVLLGICVAVHAETNAVRPGDPDWPMVWTTYRTVESLEADIEDLKAHGVGLISARANSVDKARRMLKTARRTGMKLHIHLPEITEHAGLVRQADREPVPAVMIGGVYQGKAIDRHLFTFTPDRHEIVIEPPVYNKGYAYTRGTGATGEAKKTEPIAHYFPDIGAPVRAEVVLPLKAFDGSQHLRIIDATVREAPAGTKPQVDSIKPDMPETTESRTRKLYTVAFDLSGIGEAMLDKVGVAVYWEYGGSPQYWMFGRGNVSAWATSTREGLRHHVREELDVWSRANGGSFPIDTVLAARLGDECFHITSHLGAPAVSYPLWDYSEPSIEAFERKAGDVKYPRTWGFPEVYGPDAYAWWMYTLHEGCAELCGIVQDEIASTAPGLLLFRNTTRMGVFHMSNDRDGSGQELLTQNLDIVHYDPYPVGGGGYKDVIPRDMHYGAGLARRHDRLLIPWMQAHTYAPGGLGHVSPEQVARMAAEQWVHGVDAIMWLGYGSTFPEARPESWERAGEFHHKLNASPPPKPQAELAVLRPYRAWAQCSLWDGQIRNPADWMLQQFLEVWSVDHGLPYDVFEVPPDTPLSDIPGLDAYSYIVSTEPCEGAWVIGEDTIGISVDQNSAPRLRDRLEQEMRARGWLKAGKPVVWVISDMTDKRLSGPGRWGTITDPDDISAMAGLLLFANEFDVRGLSIACTSRKEVAAAPDQARWANDYIGAAYRADLKNLNANIGGYPEDLVFMQSSIKGTRFDEDDAYTNLDSYTTVKALLAELKGMDEPLYVLCWGPTSEAAILVKHCLATDKRDLLSKIRIVAHWTNSYLHNAGGVDRVANCNFDRAACLYLKEQAGAGIVKYYECGATGQYGIVGGAPVGDAYYDQFRKSNLGKVFVGGKYMHGKVDWSDAATYVALMGTFGVTLDDLGDDGSGSAAIEQRNEDAFRAHSRRLHDELLRRSNAAATSPGGSAGQ